MKRAIVSLTPAAVLALTAFAACSSDPAGTGGDAGATTTTTSASTTTSAHGGTGGATTSQSTTSSGLTASGGGDVPLPDKFMVSGVVTDGTNPVEGAIVMQGGKMPALTTGPDGAFTIEMLNDVGVPTAVAAKIGYRSGGYEFYEPPTGPIELVIRYAAPPDNIAYKFAPPGTGDPALDNSTLICGHCHTTYAKDWRTSAHSWSAKNPIVHDLYAGVAAAITDQASCAAAGGSWKTGLVPGGTSTGSKCYLGAGVLPDLNPSCGAATSCDDPAIAPAQKPTAFGRCADCHAPGIDGVAGGRDLLEATGPAYDGGVHCDVCHHVKDVDLEKPPGVGGSVILQRPLEKVDSSPNSDRLQVLYGADPDVPNPFMGGSYQPKFLTSEYCAGCHEQKQEAMVPGTSLDPARWPSGLPTHSTYDEWVTSAFGAASFMCQQCHMPPDDHGLLNSVDTTTVEGPSLTNGFLRTPVQMRKHVFRGALEGNPRLIDAAVTVQLSVTPAAGSISVKATLGSFTAGHAVPTGEPMRSLVLVVRAFACGADLAATDGMTLDDWGGAHARGVVGPIVVNGNQITWAGAGPGVKVGSVVRAVRPTGTFVDYTGVGFFADPTLTPLEKGIEIQAPVGEATITAVAGSTLTLDKPLAAQPGDLLYAGDPLVWPPVDGSASAALAGRAGLSFARTMVDAAGARAPHFRAVDIVSDNRIPAGKSAVTQHTFAVPPGCASADVSAAVIYRRIPLDLALERGWDARDVVVSGATIPVALP